MELIKNYDVYTTEMAKSMKDKLFFLDKLGDVNCIVDYGCADGMMLEILHGINDSIELHGIDIDAEMIERARERCSYAEFTVASTPYIDEEFDYSSAALNLSSVIHEIYSYCTKEQVDAFWEAMRSSGYRYIVIRDMISNLADEVSDTEDVERVRNIPELAAKLEEFEQIWGGIEKRKNLIHFLLKYRYDLNWSREVRENYLPMSHDAILRIFEGTGYKVKYDEQFTLGFTHDVVLKDIGVEIKDVTHLKLILELVD